MKKLRKIFLLALLITSLAPAKKIAFGQSDTTLSVFPAQSNVAVTELSQISIAVSDGQNIMAYDIVIEYDADVLSLVDWVHGDYLSNLAVVYKVETPGLFHLACTQLATPPVSGSGTLFTLNFYAKILGTTQVTITNAEFADSYGNLTTPALENGAVTVEYASTTTSTSTNTNTPVTIPTSTLTQTAPSAQATATSTQLPTNLPTSLPITSTQIPARAATATPLPNMTYATSQTLTTNETLNLSQKQTATANINLSATPIIVIGEIEGPTQGQVESIPIIENNASGDLWLWVLLVSILVILVVFVVVYIRRRRALKNPDYE